MDVSYLEVIATAVIILTGGGLLQYFEFFKTKGSDFRDELREDMDNLRSTVENLQAENMHLKTQIVSLQADFEREKLAKQTLSHRLELVLRELNRYRQEEDLHPLTIDEVVIKLPTNVSDTEL